MTSQAYRHKSIYRSGLALILALIFGSAALLALAQEPSPTFSPDAVTVPDAPPGAFLGSAIYAENCAPCHGSTGNGDGPVAAELPSPATKFADATAIWDLSPAEMFHVTKFGRIEKLMPPWQNQLSDTEIWQAVYYAWSLHTDQSKVEAGAALYAQQCAACHGPTGAGDGPQGSADLPNFGDQAYLIAQSNAALLASTQAAHPALTADLSELDQTALLESIRTFGYRPPWESPVSAGEGVIRGQIIQGTPDGAAFDGDAVTLDIFAHSSLLESRTTPVDASGLFTFTKLPTDAGLLYLANTEYAGVRYGSPVLTFDAAISATVETTLPVYETSTDAANVVIDRLSWIVEHEPGALLIGQVMALGNRGERTLIGSPQAGSDVPVTVAIPLPPGATTIGFQDGELGETYRQVGNLIYDTQPLPPGQGTRQIFVRYRLPYTGTNTLVEQPLRYPVTAMNLLIAELPDLQAEATASQAALAFAGTQDIQGSAYAQWNGSALLPQTITLQLTGLLPAGAQDPRMAAPTETPSLQPLVGGILAAVMLVLMGGLLLWRWRKGTRAETAESADRRTALIAEIARLDDLHAQGQFDNEAWQQQRAMLKRELLALVRTQSGASPRE